MRTIISNNRHFVGERIDFCVLVGIWQTANASINIFIHRIYIYIYTRLAVYIVCAFF